MHAELQSYDVLVSDPRQVGKGVTCAQLLWWVSRYLSGYPSTILTLVLLGLYPSLDAIVHTLRHAGLESASTLEPALWSTMYW
jgi:hypothetical protein